METKGEVSQELPIKEKKYCQSVEELNKLVQNLKEEMKQCPSEDITFKLEELIDQYCLTRNFKMKSTSKNVDTNSINKFKETILSNISFLETFVVIPTVNSIEIENKSKKGNKFIPTKIYDINGDEIGVENFNGKQNIIFLYDNLVDLTSFIMRNKNINCAVYFIGINVNFFETKKILKKNGLLNNKMLNFCFTDVPAKSTGFATNLSLSNLPRISFIDSDGVIVEEKSIKNVTLFDVQKDFISNIGKKGNESEEQTKNEKFLFLENERKRNIVKSINIYLKKNGLNNTHFYVRAKISIDKKGIKKTRCYPIFYGEAKLEEKKMIDNLIYSLNEQQLFHDIQCKVKYNQ